MICYLLFFAIYGGNYKYVRLDIVFWFIVFVGIIVHELIHGITWAVFCEKKWYIELEESYKCIICEQEFTKGRIYEIDSMFYDSRKAVELHILEKHGSILEYLLGMNPAFIGVSQIQRELLVLTASGLTDKEIAKRQGVSQSTVRNHRYKLREKEKQVILFLAMMELIASNTKKKVNILDKDILCDAHKTATALDDRYNITDKERESILKNYLDETGAIKTFPSKKEVNSFIRNSEKFFKRKEVFRKRSKQNFTRSI